MTSSTVQVLGIEGSIGLKEAQAKELRPQVMRGEATGLICCSRTEAASNEDPAGPYALRFRLATMIRSE